MIAFLSTYSPAIFVVAFLLWLFGRACYQRGLNRGFSGGCQWEREFNHKRARREKQATGLWFGRN